MEKLAEVAKWVIIVFVTGLIAGFGKILASWIVQRRRRRARLAEESMATAPTPRPAADSAVHGLPLGTASSSAVNPNEAKARAKVAKQQAKIRKKQLKQEIKNRKNRGEG